MERLIDRCYCVNIKTLEYSQRKSHSMYHLPYAYYVYESIKVTDDLQYTQKSQNHWNIRKSRATSIVHNHINGTTQPSGYKNTWSHLFTEYSNVYGRLMGIIKRHSVEVCLIDFFLKKKGLKNFINKHWWYYSSYAHNARTVQPCVTVKSPNISDCNP